MSASSKDTDAGGTGSTAAEPERQGGACPSGSLAGLRIHVTHDPDGHDDLRRHLTHLAAVVTQASLISIRPPDDPTGLEDARRRLSEFDWVVFTSAHAVQALLTEPDRLRESRRRSGRPLIAAVGEATGRTIDQLLNDGATVNVVAEQNDSRGLVHALSTYEPGKILLPQSNLADDTVAHGLQALGWQVTGVVAYAVAPNRAMARQTADRLIDGEIDILVVTSPSNVLALKGSVPLSEWTGFVEKVRVVAIGPRTGSACRAAGCATSVAHRPTAEGIAEAIHTAVRT